MTAIHIVRAPGSAESQRQRVLQILERQADYQRRLVDDLLDVNRISQGKIQLKKERIDLRETIEHAIDTYLPAIEAKAIEFRFARPGQSNHARVNNYSATRWGPPGRSHAQADVGLG